MNSSFTSRNGAVIVSFIVALMLTMIPLPAGIEAFRPDWVALMMILWAMAVPRAYGVGVAWIVGIFLDVAQGTLLGQHALALVATTYITVKFNLLLRMFPLLQLTITVFSLNAIYQFLLFWINGVAGVSVPATVYWGPVIASVAAWPLLYILTTGVRYRIEARH